MMTARSASSTSSLSSVTLSSSHIAMPAHVQPPTPTLTATSDTTLIARNSNNNSSMRRGHIRSASLENANSFQSKNTLGLPHIPAASTSSTTMQIGHTGTLKSRNEQKRMRNKFGSHNNLEDYVQQGRAKFQNLRQMFEITKSSKSGKRDKESQMLQSLPPTLNATTVTPTATLAAGTPTATMYRQPAASNGGTQQQMQQPSGYHPAQMPRKSTPTTIAQPTTGCGNRNSITELNERLNIIEARDAKGKSRQLKQPPPQQTQPQSQSQIQAQPSPEHAQSQPQSQPQHQTQSHRQKPQLQQPRQQQQQQQQQQPRSASDLAHLQSDASENVDQATNLLRPIAFKPIPFEPDYSIPNRYCSVEHYGSTPSLAPAQGSNLRFGSTTDLRHGGVGISVGGMMGMGMGTIAGCTPPKAVLPSHKSNGPLCEIAANHNGSGIVSGTTTTTTTGNGNSNGGLIGVGGVGIVAGYSSNNYCNNLMARRRGSRSLKINDSMESIRHTPDSDTNSQSSTIKLNCGNHHGNSSHNNCNNNNNNHNNTNTNNISNNHNFHTNSSTNSNNNNTNSINNHINHHNKYMLSEQCDMTPSPSDSGISELEAALKDRDSELSYLRQTMEHNENDKETFWENETKRLKTFYESQQREFLLKLKKMEQMLAMQQFQFKQHKIKHTDQTNKLKEQVSELKHDNDIFRSNNSSLKNSERNLKDRVAYIEEQFRESQNIIEAMRQQLEESEWKVCERNGEIALLKTQLKEANVEITMKEHAIVHLKHEHNTAETQIYQSLQEQNQKSSQQQQNELMWGQNQIQQQQHQQQQQQQQQQQTESREVERETELKQLNKIVILKDQVILALTNELAKLRKELSDLAIFHEYGEEPSGKYTRLKQQLDNLTDICNKTRKHAQKSTENAAAKDKVVDDTNLELIMNCLKIAPSLSGDNRDGNGNGNGNGEQQQLSAEKRLAKMSAEIQKFVYGAHNLPDVAVNAKSKLLTFNQTLDDTTTLDTLIEESASYAEEIAKLRKQLDDVRVNFELEKHQWSEEKEKVLTYQKRLQAHYINMYQKLRSLERNTEV